MLKFNGPVLLEGRKNHLFDKRKKHLYDKIIHFSMQFSAVLNIFIVKTKLNSTFTNDLKRK